MAEQTSLLVAKDLKVTIGTGKKSVTVLDDVSFKILPNEVVGLVGESGCGKSSLAKAILKLLPISSGQLIIKDQDVTHLKEKQFRPFRRNIQMILQDPYDSLDPTKTVASLLKEPLLIHKIGKKSERNSLIESILTEVGLTNSHLPLKSFQLSGGQCQRVNIARALLVSPEIIVCDEIVSALDVSIQAQILNLLKELKAKQNLSLLFITHNIALLNYLADYLLVMYLGKIVEQGPVSEVIKNPRHHYSSLLTSSAKLTSSHISIAPDKLTISEIASLSSPPSGCRFHPRCPAATEVCKEVSPTLEQIGPKHYVACHHPVEFINKSELKSS